jgi:hypothetical protein
MNKTVRLALGVGCIALIIIAALALLPTTTVQVTSSADHTFELDAAMPRVRKILVRTNAVKKIVAMANAEFLDQKWLQLQFEIDRPILKRDWHLDGNGELNVRTNDRYIGSHDITLKQAIDITPERLFVTNQLAEPSGPIRQYASTLTLTPGENGKALIASHLDLTINTTASWLTQTIVQRKIRESAGIALRRQEQAIRDIVQQHAEDLIILPEKKGPDG